MIMVARRQSHLSINSMFSLPPPRTPEASWPVHFQRAADCQGLPQKNCCVSLCLIASGVSHPLHVPVLNPAQPPGMKGSSLTAEVSRFGF